MIIVLDGNIWQKLVDFVERGVVKSGILIIEKHLIDDRGLHWVCNLGGKKPERRKLLGRVELDSIELADISSIKNKHVKAAGFGSKEFLKRTFATCLERSPREINLITVAEMKIAETERYWCPNPECISVNLNFLNKDIFNDQLPFSCFNCGGEFYTKDLDFGSPRVKNAKLSERYCEDNIKKIPMDQQIVMAVAGEYWSA